MQSDTADPLLPYYYEHEPQFICGMETPSITDDWVENHPGVVDRFFKRYYYIKDGNDPAPYQILFHSNRICLICLAPEHPALKSGIKSLNFDIGNTDRSKNKVKGKGKKGGMVLQHDSTLAILTSEQEKAYKIPSCVQSKLIEVNTLWVDEPKRLETTAEGEGYIAIVLLKPEDCEAIKRSLLTQEQYNDKWAELEKNGSKSVVKPELGIKADDNVVDVDKGDICVNK